MKVANFKGDMEGIKIFKPIQYLYFKGQAKNGIGNVKIRVRIVNSENGRVEEIVPLMSLSVLGEIASMNEGFYTFRVEDDGSDQFRVNVMLHPTSAIYLSNDKYLEVDVLGTSATYSTTLYGIEKPVVDKDFVCRYNKFYMSAGELQKTFSVGENENLVLPDASFEEVCLQFKNGSSCTYTKEEMQSLMMLQNDIVSVPELSFEFRDITQDTALDASYLAFGSLSMYGLDVSDVESFSIRRSAAANAFEFILMDTIKE